MFTRAFDPISMNKSTQNPLPERTPTLHDIWRLLCDSALILASCCSRVRIRVTGSGPTKGMPVLSVARRGDEVAGCHEGHATAHGPEPRHTDPTPPTELPAG
eukprot:356968-Chlamydomonas_euryale.AAC.17